MEQAHCGEQFKPKSLSYRISSNLTMRPIPGKQRRFKKKKKKKRAMRPFFRKFTRGSDQLDRDGKRCGGVAPRCSPQGGGGVAPRCSPQGGGGVTPRCSQQNVRANSNAGDKADKAGVEVRFHMDGTVTALQWERGPQKSSCRKYE